MKYYRSQKEPSFEGGVHYATRSREYADGFGGGFIVTFEIDPGDIIVIKEALKGTLFPDALIPVVSSGARPLIDVLRALECAGKQMADISDPTRIRSILLNRLIGDEMDAIYALSDEESLGVKRFLAGSRSLFNGLIEDTTFVFPNAVGISDPNGRGENVVLFGDAYKRVMGIARKG